MSMYWTLKPIILTISTLILHNTVLQTPFFLLFSEAGFEPAILGLWVKWSTTVLSGHNPQNTTLKIQRASGNQTGLQWNSTL